MRVLLDTNVLVDELALPDACEYAVSIVSLAELHFGVLRAGGSDQLGPRVRRLVEVERGFAPLPVDHRVALAYAECAEAVARSGRNPRPRSFDLLIAATARAEGATLCTSNPDDFRGLEGLVTVVSPAELGAAR